MTAERLDSMEGQIRRLTSSLQILGRQLETFLGDQSEHLGRRPAEARPAETAERRNVVPGVDFEPPRASPNGGAPQASPTVPFAPDVPAGAPRDSQDPLMTDPWTTWLQRQGIPLPPPGFSRVPNVVDEEPSFDRVDRDGGRDDDDNPFKRSEKWMPSLPRPNFSTWKSRPTEVVGFVDYVGEYWSGFQYISKRDHEFFA